MARSKDTTPTLVGLFLFVGLVILGLLILQYGKIPKGEIEQYTLYARFSDATGILEGSDVRLGGAKIGQVAALPVLNETFDQVLVTLSINEGINLPRNAEITISGAGLLGDKYVSIQVPAGTKPDQVGYFKAEETVDGISASSLTTLQVKVENLSEKAGNALADVQTGVVRITAAVDEFEKMARNINIAVDKFNNGVMSDANVSDLRSTMEKLRKTSENLATASAKLDPVLDKGGKTFDNIDSTLAEIRGIFQDLKPVTEKVKTSVDRIGTAADSLNLGVQKLTTGDGLLPALVNDQNLRDQFTALIRNTKQHGILFYKDEDAQSKSSKEQRKAPSTPLFRR